MQLSACVHLVGSGILGLSLTDEYDCNVYLLDGGTECALVDTGAGYRLQPLLDEIARSGIDPGRIGRIFLTHKHADHSGGAAELKRLTGASVHATEITARAVGEADTFNRGLERARRSGAYPADYVFRGVEVDEVVRHGDLVAVGELELRVLDTPGHCAGHCSFVLDTGEATFLFTGDALLPGGQVVLQPIADCSLPETVASIELLGSVEPDLLLSGHGAPVLADGRRHVEFALARIRAGKVPDQLVIPSR